MDYAVPYETRVIPRDPVIRPEIRMERPVQTARPDLTSDEYRDAKRRSSSTATLVGIFAVVVFLVVLLAVFILPPMNEWFSRPEEPITIPNFVGRKYEDIAANTDYDELYNFSVTYETNSDVADGVVISQDPAADRTRSRPVSNERITIRLVVSSGDEPPGEMPDLRGLHFVEARNQLLNMHLDLVIDLDPVTDEEQRGVVIETVPAAREKVSRGNTVVIRYSMGPEEIRVTVPDLEGSTQAAVEAAFRDLDLVPDIRMFEDSRPAGTVTFIAHAGETVLAGSRIAVHVSSGPPETPEPPTPSPTPDPTPTPTPDPPTPTPPPDTPPPETSDPG